MATQAKNSGRGAHFASKGALDAQSKQSSPKHSSKDQTPKFQPQTIQPVDLSACVKPAHGKRSNSPKKKQGRTRRIISTALIVIGVVLLVVAAGIFIKAQLGYKEASDSYAEVQEAAITDTSGDGIPTIDFDALEAINADVVGWIYIPDTCINYPVVQTDDNTTYLWTLFSSDSNTCGTIFMDMDGTAPGMVDQQTTIYGHQMNDGSMFTPIEYTLSQDEFDSIEHVYYITRDATYTCTPLYTMKIEDSYNDARVANFDSEDDFMAYLRAGLKLAGASADDASDKLEGADKVLTLITCEGQIVPRTSRAAMVCVVEETA